MEREAAGGASPPSRRLVLLAAAAGLAGCQSWPPIKPAPAGTRAIGDAHAHLFNAADLPIHNFLRFVAIREQFGELSPPAQALLDLFLNVVQPFAVTARAELAAGRDLVPREIDVAPEVFAERAAQRSVDAMGAAGRAWDKAADDGRSASYAVVSAVVLQAHGSGDFLALKAVPDPASLREALRLAYLDLARAALAGEDSPSVNASLEAKAFAPAELKLLQAAVDPDEVVRTIKWGVLMLQSRTSHLRRHVERLAAPDARTALLVNLLVDYDAWLQDGPVAGASHLQQVELWDAVRRRYADRVDVRTFAGYCPLKHAIERRRGGVTHFDRLTAAHAQGKIFGLKLYPPMGFRAWGNARLDDEPDFVGRDGIRRRVLDAWRREGAEPLGPQLDKALGKAYKWCLKASVPILAHAGPSLAPAKGWEERANPAYWALAVDQFPGLHVCLGHFVHDPARFVKAMNGGPSAGVWALEATRELVRDPPQGQSTVFADISYTHEILSDSGLATAFFDAVRRYCEAYDPDFSQLLYGSDWIMLGREPNNLRYLDLVRRGMSDAGWKPWAIENVCEKNLRRFLYLA